MANFEQNIVSRMAGKFTFYKDFFITINSFLLGVFSLATSLQIGNVTLLNYSYKMKQYRNYIYFFLKTTTRFKDS